MQGGNGMNDRADPSSVEGDSESGLGSARPALSPEDKRTLLDLARQSLEAHLRHRDFLNLEVDSPALLEHRAAFVTWRRRSTGELRGCIGEVIAQRPLAESVAKMAVHAGTKDPRFPPIGLDELLHLVVEISALTPMTPIEPDRVEVGRHGLMVSKGGLSGLLLPQVPVEQGWNREEFLGGLCLKAGLPESAWREGDVELRSFEAEVWGEESTE